MPTLLIPGFGGEVPRIEPRTLEEHQSARAVNCDLRRGSLRPLRGVRRVAEVSASARTIFKHDIDGWLAWDKDVSVVKSAVIDVIGETPLGHLLITGDRDYPTQRFAGGETYRLGIPRPETAPTVTVKAGAGIGDVSVHGFIAGSGGDMPTKDSQLAPVEGQGVAVAPIVFSSIDGIPPSTEAEKISRSSSYCYTYVQSLQGGVYQQESAPSPPSELVDVKSGDGALVSGFRLPSLSGLNITHIRIYRTVAGNETGEFRFVAEIPVSQAEHMDTAHDKDVPTDVLQTTLWDRIPDDAQGLIKTDNGITTIKAEFIDEDDSTLRVSYRGALEFENRINDSYRGDSKLNADYAMNADAPVVSIKKITDECTARYDRWDLHFYEKECYATQGATGYYLWFRLKTAPGQEYIPSGTYKATSDDTPGFLPGTREDLGGGNLRAVNTWFYSGRTPHAPMTNGSLTLKTSNGTDYEVSFSTGDDHPMPYLVTGSFSGTVKKLASN